MPLPDKPRFSQLSSRWQALVRLCQSTNYGHIQDLLIAAREPVLGPASAVFTDLKLDSEDRPRDEVKRADFVLCAEIIRLLAALDQINNGKISRLEVRAGIPRRVVLEQRISELGDHSP